RGRRRHRPGRVVRVEQPAGRVAARRRRPHPHDARRGPVLKRALPLLLAIGAALAIGGCRPPPSQVLIIVDAQPAVRQVTAGLSVNIWGGDRNTELPEVVVHAITDPSSPERWPRRFAV